MKEGGTKEEKLLIFDFDGVLAEGVEMLEALPLEIFKGFLPENEICKYGNPVEWKTTNWIEELRAMGIGVNPEILHEFSERMFNFYGAKYRVRESLCRIIPELAQRSNLAIFTNNSRETVQYVLKELTGHFQSIKSWEDIAPDLKPSPRGILEICEELGVKKENALMLGDKADDFIAANQAGIGIVSVCWDTHCFQTTFPFYKAIYTEEDLLDLLN